MVGQKFIIRLKRYASTFRRRTLDNSLVRFVIRVMVEMSKDDGTNMAAAVAYYSFLSIFPLILGIIGLFGLFLPSQEIQSQIFSFIQNNFPSARDVLENNISNVIQLRGTLGIIAIIGLLWSGSGILGAVGHAINRAWDVRRGLPFLLRKPRDIGLTLGLGVLFSASFAATSFVSLAPDTYVPVVGTSIVQILIRVIAFLLFLAIFLILFKVMPHTQTRWRYIWPGAIFTAILFEIGRVLFIFYLDNFGNFALIYGTIGSIIAMLVWIYYSAIIVILGAEFSAEYSRMRRGVQKGGY